MGDNHDSIRLAGRCRFKRGDRIGRCRPKELAKCQVWADQCCDIAFNIDDLCSFLCIGVYVEYFQLAHHSKWQRSIVKVSKMWILSSLGERSYSYQRDEKYWLWNRDQCSCLCTKLLWQIKQIRSIWRLCPREASVSWSWRSNLSFWKRPMPCQSVKCVLFIDWLCHCDRSWIQCTRKLSLQAYSHMFAN